MQTAINDNRSKRNVMRDTIADLQEKLRQQYVAQNTAKMNINQVEAKTKEIQAGYGEIQREADGDPPPDRGRPEADHNKIAEELKASEQDEKKNWKLLSRPGTGRIGGLENRGAGGFRKLEALLSGSQYSPAERKLQQRLWIV